MDKLDADSCGKPVACMPPPPRFIPVPGPPPPGLATAVRMSRANLRGLNVVIRASATVTDAIDQFSRATATGNGFHHGPARRHNFDKEK